MQSSKLVLDRAKSVLYVLYRCVKCLLRYRFISVPLAVLGVNLLLLLNNCKVPVFVGYLTCYDGLRTFNFSILLSEMRVNCTAKTILQTCSNVIMLILSVLLCALLFTYVVLLKLKLTSRPAYESIVRIISDVLFIASIVFLLPFPELLRTFNFELLMFAPSPEISTILTLCSLSILIMNDLLSQKSGKVTDVLVSIDELIEPTLPIEEERREVETT